MSEYKLMSEERLKQVSAMCLPAPCHELLEHIYAQAKLIELGDQLLADRNRLLAMFDCPSHGPCVPYAMEQVTAMRAENAKVAALKATLQDLAAGATDMLNGWREIREKGGEQSVYGIGWDRAQQHVESAGRCPRHAE